MNIKLIILFSFFYLISFVFAEIIKKKLRIETEYTRKWIHVSSGIISLFLPLAFDNHINVLILSLEFLSILIITKAIGQFKSLNDVKRMTYGSYLFPFAIYLCFYIYEQTGELIFYLLPVLILTISDTIASLTGKYFTERNYRYNNPKIFYVLKSKSQMGSLFFFISSLLISIIVLLNFVNKDLIFIILTSVIISYLCSQVEAISPKGTDNLLVPLTAIITLSIFLYY